MGSSTGTSCPETIKQTSNKINPPPEKPATRGFATTRDARSMLMPMPECLRQRHRRQRETVSRAKASVDRSFPFARRNGWANLATPQLYDKWCCAGQCGDGNLKILVRITTGGDYDRWIDPMRATEDEELRMICRNPERRATIGPGQFGVAPLIKSYPAWVSCRPPTICCVPYWLAGEWTYNLDFDISALAIPHAATNVANTRIKVLGRRCLMMPNACVSEQEAAGDGFRNQNEGGGCLLFARRNG